MSREAIEARLRQQPDDWEAWLVYGDWLTERGDIRGRRIALAHQIETAPLPPPARNALRREAAAIDRAHGPAWRAEIVLPEGARPVWRCGFVVGVKLRWDPETLDAIDRLKAHPAARLLLALDLSAKRIGVRGTERLARSGALRGIRALHLRTNRIGDRGAAALAASDAAAGLAILDVSDNNLTRAGIDALCRSPNLSALEALSLGQNGLGAAAAYALAEATLPRLAALDLRFNCIDAGGVEALAQSAALSTLRSLNLDANRIGPGWVALWRSATLRLRHLDLRLNDLGEQALEHLAASESFANLRSLVLSANPIGAVGARAIARSARLTSLRSLDLSDCALGPADAAALAEATWAPTVEALTLDDNPIRNGGAASLAGAAAFGALRSLALRGCQIRAEGAAAIARSTAFGSLEALDLTDNGLNSETRGALSRAPGLQGCRVQT